MNHVPQEIGVSPSLHVYSLSDVVGAWFAASQADSVHRVGEMGKRLEGRV